jgi:arginine exporter protein ArgO
VRIEPVNALFTLSVTFILRSRVYGVEWMDRVGRFFLAIAGLLSIATAAPAGAASAVPNKQAVATIQVLPPIALRKLEDLNFATLGVYGAGTATINPNTDIMTVTGGVIYLGQTPYSALFEAVAPTKSVVHIRVPRSSAVVTRVGGTETMTVDTFTISGSPNRNVVAKEPFSFSVGGTLHVNNNQAEGMYVGTFDVDVQYN